MKVIFELHLLGYGFDLRIFSTLMRILFVVRMLAVGRRLGSLDVGITAVAFELRFGCRSRRRFSSIVTWILSLIGLGARWIFAWFLIHPTNLIYFFGVTLQLDLGSQVSSYQSRPQSISPYLVNSSLPSWFYWECLSLHLGFLMPMYSWLRWPFHPRTSFLFRQQQTCQTKDLVFTEYQSHKHPFLELQQINY